MMNGTPILDEILYRDLRPWLEENESDEKYFALNAKFKEMVPSFHLRYSIDFPRPYNNKTKYYHKLISNAAATYSAEIIAHIHGYEDESVILYLLNSILEKKLKNSIRDLARILKEKDFSMTYLGKNYIPSPAEVSHKSDTYIMQLLKLAYMKVFLEVQEEFRQYRDDILIPADFYSQLLDEPIPDHIPISKILTIEVDPPPKAIVKSTQSEIRTPAKSFLYKKLATQADHLDDLWDNLIKNGFIAENTSKVNFKKAFSGKTVTAPIVWVGLPSELSYFIKLIHNEHQLVEDLKQKQWKVVPLCFVDKENSSDAYRNIRKLQRPETKGDLLDRAVELLF